MHTVKYGSSGLMADHLERNHLFTVCMLSTAHDANDSRITYKEAVSLAKAGYNTLFIVPHHGEEVIEGVRIVPLPIPRSRSERMWTTTWRLYQAARQIDADVYHFHDPELIPIGMLLKKKGYRVIYDVHEDVPRQILSKGWIPKWLRGSVSRLVERIELWASLRFDAIVTATTHIEERFARHPKCYTETVCNYPILDEFVQTAESPQSVQSVQSGEFVGIPQHAGKEDAVCYVGSIGNIRGLQQIVGAMEFGISDKKLLLAGSFASAEEKHVAMGRSGWAKVDYLGQLNRKQVYETMARSRAGLVILHPTINYIDALPIKLFEYMAAGIPVIASDFPKWRQIIEQAGCGFCVDPFDLEGISKRIDWLITHHEEAEEMGRRGQEAVQSLYHWNVEKEKLLHVYADVTGRIRKEEVQQTAFGTMNRERERKVVK